MTIKELNDYIKKSLSENHIEYADEESVIILENILKYDKTKLLLNGSKIVDTKTVNTINSIIDRRIKGEPLQYILGIWQFMGLDFLVGSGVLIPRDDTEILVNAASAIIKKENINNLVDLCSGSGIISILLKHQYKNLEVTAVEKSSIAYNYLLKNIKKHNLDINAVNLEIEDYVKKINDNTIDLLVSNPPYIKTDDIKNLQKEIQYEPFMALDGGNDGLDFYRYIINNYKNKIKSGGYIAFEIGEGQYKDVSYILLDNGFVDLSSYNDIQNIVRVVSARKN